MALLKFFGFDLFGAHPTPYVGSVHGLGILNTPYGNEFNMQILGLDSAVAVSSAAAAVMGEGTPEQRNALVTVRSGGSGNRTAYFWPLPALNLRTDVPFRYVIGFSVRKLHGTSLMSERKLVTLPFDTTLISYMANGELKFLDSTSNRPTLTQSDGEKYIEIVIINELENPENPPASKTLKVQFYVDGVFNYEGYTTAAFSSSGTVNGYVYMGIINSSSTDTNPLGFSFADIYLLDHTGDAPYNDRLGPQKVLPIFPTELVGDTNWGLSEGDDHVALIGEDDARNDSTYITSPETEDTISLKIDYGTNPNSIVNGLRFFARAQRGGGAARILSTTLLDDADESIGTSIEATPTTSWADHEVARVYPSNVEETVELSHASLSGSALVLKALV